MTAALDSLLIELALRLQVLGREIGVSMGVDGDACAAIAAMSGAIVSETIYADATCEPYVIRSASVRIGHVTLQAQAGKRPATSIEMEHAASWSEYESRFRVGVLRNGGAP